MLLLTKQELNRVDIHSNKFIVLTFLIFAFNNMIRGKTGWGGISHLVGGLSNI